MKIFLTITSVFAFTATCLAQQPEPAIGRATYQLTWMRDTNNRANPYTEQMVLLAGRTASAYRSLDKQKAQDQMIKSMQEQVKAAPNPNALALNIVGSPPTQAEEYYQYIKDKKLLVEENLVNFYLVTEPLPAMKWTIQKDTTSFGTLHCQKATTHFGGRDYTAWFCPELPFQNGPWKLNGLPGLILEASDSKKEVIFKFGGFEDVSTQGLTIDPAKDDIPASRQEINRLKEVQKKDPMGFSKASRGSGQARRNFTGMDSIDPSKIASINVKAYSGPITKIINNPMELPETAKK